MAYVKTNWVDNTTLIDKDNLNKIESGIKNNDINIGEENYDNTKTYEVGDIVRYNEKIYKCITAITTAENFDISKWEQTNIVEIVQSEKSKIYELIEALSTPIVGEGEYITLNDTAEKRFEKFDIEGNSEQETRSGKNKYNGNDFTREGWGVSFTNLTNLVNSLAVGDYTISFDVEIASITKEDTRSYLSQISYTTEGVLPKKDYSLTFPAKNVGSKVHFSFQINITNETAGKYSFMLYPMGNHSVGPCGSSTYKNIQVELGTQETSYEPYGAMPSPDYPSEIKTVGSNVNIFEATEKSFYSSESGKYVEYLKDTNEYHITSTQTWYRYTLNNLKIGKEYTLSFEAKSSTVNSQMNGFLRIDKISDGAILKAFDTSVLTSAEYKRYSLTFIPTENSLYINIRNTNGIDAYIKNIKLVEGTETGEYSKYGQGCVKVTKCNKNLAIKNVKGYFSISDFKIKIDNNSEAFLFYAEKGKEYTRSCKVNLDRNSIGKIDTLDITQGMTVLNGQEINSNKFICDDSGIYIWFVNSTLNDSIKESFQIEEGSTESTFEQHEEQSYIMPVQQEMLECDYFDFDNEEEVHTWDKLVLNGTEDWKFRHSANNRRCFGLQNLGKKYVNPVLCTHLMQASASAVFNCTVEGIVVIDFIQLSINNNRITEQTVAGFKTWLKAQYDAGTPVIIYCTLATPERLKFTDEQKAVAKKLNNAKTYKGVTHIYSNDAVSPNCYVEAVKDLTTLIQ